MAEDQEARRFDASFDPLLTPSQVHEQMDAMDQMDASQQAAQFQHLALHPYLAGVVAESRDPGLITRVCDAADAYLLPDQGILLLRDILTNDALDVVAAEGNWQQVDTVLHAAGALPADRSGEALLHLMTKRVMQLVAAQGNPADVARMCRAVMRMQDGHRKWALPVLLSDGAVARVANEGKASDVLAVVNAARELPHPQHKQAALMRLLGARAQAEVAANGTEQERHAMASAWSDLPPADPAQTWPQYQQLLDRHQAGVRSKSPSPARSHESG